MKLTAEQYQAADFIAMRRGEKYVVLKNRGGKVGMVPNLYAVLLIARTHTAGRCIIAHEDAS